MKVIVFGAAGATGRLVVEEALARGHEVTAFVRDPAKLGPLAERVRVAAGDALDPAAVEAALPGHDAAVHAIGSGSMAATTVRTDTARILVAGMQRAGVQRLVAMSGLGAGDSRAALPLFVRWVIVPLVLGRLLADQDGLEREVRASALAWTLVRPGELKDVPRKGGVRTALDGRGLSMGVPRGDVAAFIVDQLASDAFLRAAPGLGAA